MQIKMGIIELTLYWLSKWLLTRMHALKSCLWCITTKKEFVEQIGFKNMLPTSCQIKYRSKFKTRWLTTRTPKIQWTKG